MPLSWAKGGEPPLAFDYTHISAAGVSRRYALGSRMGVGFGLELLCPSSTPGALAADM